MRKAGGGALALIACLLLGGCSDDGVQEVESADESVQGVSRDEIEYQAEPMTLEEAERLGIVDTTIGLGDPANPDSIVPLDGPTTIPFDTAATPQVEVAP